jgi:acyl carrier protein
MPLTFDTALAAVQAAVDEMNLSLPEDKQLSKDPDAVLFGDGSALDSVGLVNVVMAAEQHVGDATGEDIVLASEAAMSRKRSPYRSLKALAEYAVELSSESEPARA